MRRRQPIGRGQAWLVFDAGGDLFSYQCYWMAGECDDHLVEHALVLTDADAVAWAAARTPRARIRMPDHVTYWAGRESPPSGLYRSWQPSGTVATHSEAAAPLRAGAA